MPNTLIPNRSYIIRLIVEDMITHRNGTHSTTVYTTTGNVISVEIDSRYNQNGYVNPDKESLFVAQCSLNGTRIKIDQSNFTWTVRDSIGQEVDLIDAKIVKNSLKLPADLLTYDDFYIIDVTAEYLGFAGTATIRYDTMLETNYTLEIQPTTGVAFSTDFFITAVSQMVDGEIATFSFGYIKNNTKYLLNRSSPSPSNIINLPQGETSNVLTVF